MIGRGLPCGAQVYTQSDLEFAHASNDRTGAYVAVIGVALDLATNTSSNSTVPEKLLGALVHGEEMFLRALDYLAGRHVIVYREGLGIPPKIVNDACAMLKVNYNAENHLISSNFHLIEVLDEGASLRPEFVHERKLWQTGALGNLSPLEHTKILTPNHILNTKTFRTLRFYPRDTLPTTDNISDLADEFILLARAQASMLGSRRRLVRGLTAGMDSRASLALIRNQNDVFFTYYTRPVERADALIAGQIADRLSLDHFILASEEQFDATVALGGTSKVIPVSIDKKLVRRVKAWSWYKHRASLISAYAQSLLPNIPGKTLHIRSNLNEIGRAFWGKNGPCHERGDVLPRAKPLWHKFAKDHFTRFFDETEFTAEKLYGYDMLDMFYWEHRCGTWISEVLQETDFAFDTHAFINCRRMLEISLSAPFLSRRAGSLFTEIFKRGAPELSDIPINPRL